MSFDPVANGAVPFDPAANGAVSVAFNPADHATPAEDDVPPDSQMTAAQVHAKSTGSYGSLEPKEPGLAHLLWSIGKPFMDIGETARGQAPLPAPGKDSLMMAATPALMARLDVGAPPEPTPSFGAADTFANRRAAAQLPAVTDPATQASFLRVAKMADAAKADPALAGTNPSDLQVMGGVRSELNSHLDSVLADLAESKLLTAGQTSFLKNATEAASAHTRTITPGMLSGVDELGLPPEVVGYVKNKLMDANIASTQQYGTAAGGVGKSIGATIGSHIPLVPAVVGKPVGSFIGGLVDRGMGTQSPQASLQAMRIAQQMRVVGLDPDVAGAPLVRPGMPQAPIPPGRMPPFVRPAVPTPEAPAPAPPFIRPAVAPPAPPAVTPPGAAMAQLAQVRAAGQRALAEQQASVGGPGQPDPATGLPPSAIPPNVPIRANVPTPAPQPPQSTLPPLRVDTPQTVGAVMAQDAGAAPSAIGGNTPGARYLVQGVSGAATHTDAVNIAQGAEAAGVVPTGFAAKVAFSTAPVPQAELEAAKSFAMGKQRADVGLDTGPYSPDIRKAVAMKTYVDNTQRLVATITDPTVQAAVSNIVSEPTLAGKATLAQQLGANPAVKATLDANQWLLKTGGK